MLSPSLPLAPIYRPPLSIVLRRITKIVGNEYEVSCKLTTFILPVLFRRLFSLRFFLKASHPRSARSRKMTVSRYLSIHFFRSVFRMYEEEIIKSVGISNEKFASHFCYMHNNSLIIRFFFIMNLKQFRREWSPIRFNINLTNN